MNKKSFVVFILLFFGLNVIAQTNICFHVMPDGSFQSEANEDYIVVPFEGKSAQEIYLELATNINSIYNSPKNVMNGVEYSSIKIRAIGGLVYDKSIIGIVSILDAHYQLEFKIKDNRVRVSAPFIEESLSLKTDGLPFKEYSKVVKGYFKNGKLKEKKQKDYDFLNNQINSIIEKILGLDKAEDDNW